MLPPPYHLINCLLKRYLTMHHTLSPLSTNVPNTTAFPSRSHTVTEGSKTSTAHPSPTHHAKTSSKAHPSHPTPIHQTHQPASAPQPSPRASDASTAPPKTRPSYETETPTIHVNDSPVDENTCVGRSGRMGKGASCARGVGRDDIVCRYFFRCFEVWSTCSVFVLINLRRVNVVCHEKSQT